MIDEKFPEGICLRGLQSHCGGSKKKEAFYLYCRIKAPTILNRWNWRELGFQKIDYHLEETAKIWKCGGVPAMGIIKARNVKYDYIKYDDSGQPSESYRAVDDVNLDISKGRFISILGA